MQNVAIIGSKRVATTLYNNQERLEVDNLSVVGIINVDETSPNQLASSFEYDLGRLDDISEIVRKNKLDRVLLAIDSKDFEKLHDVIQRCEQGNVEYDIIDRLDEKMPAPNGSSEFAALAPDEAILEDFWLQRVIDFVVSVLMFIVFLPSWLVIAIAIKLESKGPVFYSQERVGKNGKIFRIHKFRSMCQDAEVAGGPQLATQNDPRITSVGNVLRKTRLDEIPQLINVIKGEMSLIGPRPERPFFVEKYGQEIPMYMNRLRVKPGLTGWAQVESGYDESIEDVKEKLRHDLFYIENQRSLHLYLKIWLKTVWVVLTAKGQ